ncbi:MAG TPA: DNA polymerase/3'-5' exonuclease PolX [Acetomicrobium sp.]|uniref:DNA polymerase/3'-5' exonuclease PolX n=1 Tax=Acetomicrobium mobile TaxID=97477 RepID=UPI0026ED5F02|nr:DNA polymerase/3'-5' exonuclease PolX [Acetomicrobium mobile]HOB10428.1 DNA polymerase/3'-5' exonuclease PolX [Acetomicrobium sp.]HOM96869.1 DNA polymerase/3'-5' exonuclease PolX [Acetomicrobium sp.]HQA36395.1 DNA polymerase/3'-5' exonuclease PolX [Acetomicrobium sp.]
MRREIDADFLANLFDRIAILLEIKGENPFKVNAYRRAAENLRRETRDIVELYKEGKLTEIPGVGKAIAQKITEILENGKLEFYDKLTAEIPERLLSLYEVPEMGPKRIKLVWEKLGIDSVEKLEKAALEGTLRSLPGFGPKIESKILEGIMALKERRLVSRYPLGEGWDLSRIIVNRLGEFEGVVFVSPAGSLRRMKETIGDLDILVAAEKDATNKIIKAFTDLEIVEEVLLSGPTKTSIRFKGGLQGDLRIVEPSRWGTALQYFTGSQQHNISLREIALKKNLSLSEYALTDKINNKEILCSSEEEVYEKLGMSWIPPEIREGTIEINLALEGKLPRLVEVGDIEGDLQMHSTWSDGKRSIKEMAEKAYALGRSYILITDHSQGLGIAGGLSIGRLMDQWHEIDELNEIFEGKLVILKGAEVEVRTDGTLDYPDEVLERLDVVVAALHSNLRQDRGQLTERYIKAISHPLVHILAHPSGRLFGVREEANADWERIFKAAASSGTLLEINAHPSRLDLSEKKIRQAFNLGCKFVISTDAHDIHEQEYMFFGVAQARRAWLKRSDVANAQPLKSFLEQIKR